MADSINVIPDDEQNDISATRMLFNVEEDISLDTTLSAFVDSSTRHLHDLRDLPSHLSRNNDGLEALSEFLTTIPDVPVNGVPDYATFRPVDKHPPDTSSSAPVRGFSTLNTRSPASNLPDAKMKTSCAYPRSLKSTSAIQKPSHQRTCMGSLVTELKRNVSSLNSYVSIDTAPTLPRIAPDEMRRVARRTPGVEAKRLQHNMMMRANRQRVNNKFHELEKMLATLESPHVSSKAVRNKIQTLDHVMLQYPSMQARKASLRAQLVLAKCYDQVKGLRLVDMFGSTLESACETVARIAFGEQQWKYAEVYIKSQQRYRLSAALVSPGNMTRTQEQLHVFSRRRMSSDTWKLISGAAKIGQSVWIPDVRRREQDESSVKAGVSSALFVPVVLSEGRMADAVIALYHADDGVKNYPGGIRPYCAMDVALVDELAIALRNNMNTEV